MKEGVRRYRAARVEATHRMRNIRPIEMNRSRNVLSIVTHHLFLIYPKDYLIFWKKQG